MEDPNQIKIINSLRKKETVKRKYEGFAYGDFCYETQNSSGFDKAKFDLFADPKMLPQIKLKPIKLQPIQFKPKMPLVVDVEIKKEDIIPDIEIVESTPSKYSEDIGLRDPIDSQSIHSENDLTRYVVAVETTNELESPGKKSHYFKLILVFMNQKLLQKFLFFTIKINIIFENKFLQ